MFNCQRVNKDGDEDEGWRRRSLWSEHMCVSEHWLCICPRFWPLQYGTCSLLTSCFLKCQTNPYITRWCPPLTGWFMNPSTWFDASSTNMSAVDQVIKTNVATQWTMVPTCSNIFINFFGRNIAYSEHHPHILPVCKLVEAHEANDIFQQNGSWRVLYPPGEATHLVNCHSFGWP